jgi:2TM domain
MNGVTKLLEARRHIAALNGFYVHLGVYVVVNAILIAINASSPGGWWAQWPLIGWGIGLVCHGVTVFSTQSRMGKDWEARQIKAHMDKR